ncbi:MAG TPA: tetraacyldisaccharide 4'-kinase [Bacteroidia bacterium]|nr:tetraacyldisaccharide 4'-kinase [Bacteroidia bacterium]
MSKSSIFEAMRILFYPLALVYAIITSLRNLFFNVGLLRERSFPLPIIGVGNLSTGGTGKSPHVIYLAALLKDDKKVAVLSRGYGRRSKGYREVNVADSVGLTGDEPLQYKTLYPELTVAVCEKRVDGIEMLMKEKHPEVILLDDSFQHRYVKPGLNLMLTDYNDLFYNDHILPAGNLREVRRGVKRADAVIVSKTNPLPNLQEFEKIDRKIRRYGVQEVFFSYMRYREYVESGNGERMALSELKNKKVMVVAGIANPQPLIDFLQMHSDKVEIEKYGDHHAFTAGDLTALTKKFDMFAAARKEGAVIITTRKDYMRLNSAELAHLLKRLPVVILDIEICFHTFGQQKFDHYILNYVKKNSGIR